MPGVRFYAGMPLRPLDGQPIGTLCVIDTRPRVLGARELDCLARFARQAEELIRHHLASLASRRQQDSLELAVARNEALLNRAAVGIIRITSRGIIEQVNPFAQQILGYTADELLAESMRVVQCPPQVIGKRL